MTSVTTLENLSTEFDGFLIDQFGVMMDGAGPYAGAADALNWLHEQRKKIVILSNSGKRAEENIERLLRFGFSRESFITIQSSGETANRILQTEFGRQENLPVFLISRDNDLSPLSGFSCERTNDPEQAAHILIAGSEAEKYELHDYENLLRPAAEIGVPAICTNPDLVFLSGDWRGFGSGVIADAYEKMGGTVRYIGKPYPDIYLDALDHMSDIPHEKIICIGDSIYHDLKGAKSMSLPCALVETGLLIGQTPKEIEELARAEIGEEPDFILQKFALE